MFELGKCYAHNGGCQMKIVGIMDSTMFGTCFVGEEIGGKFIPVGMSNENFVNWYEISKDSWMKNFSK